MASTVSGRGTSQVGSVCIVTDSTAALPAAVRSHPALRIVPLRVIVDECTYRDGEDLTEVELATALGEGAVATTSQPPVPDFVAAYRWAADQGFSAAVSLHISGELSGTVHAAALAALEVGISVQVVDSRTTGAALGAAVCDALDASGEGLSAREVTQVAMAAASQSRTWFVVESLEHLRRGGRLSRTAATVGTVLGVRPILTVSAGKVELEHVARTRTAALRRILTNAAEFLDQAADPELFVHHLGDQAAGDALANLVHERTGLLPTVLGAGCVLGAHVGPGMVAVVAVDHGGGTVARTGGR